MINVQQAIDSAFTFINTLYSTQLPGLRLEEVELSDDERRWLITMGFLEAADSALVQQPTSAAEAFVRALRTTPSEPQRVYKRIEIDAATGEPKAMKIRQL